MDSKQLIFFIESEYKKKKQMKSNWENYFFFLKQLVGEERDEYLGMIIEIFIIFTDLVDDLMDEDKPSVNQMLKRNQTELSEYLFLAFTAIRVHLPKDQFGFFIDSVAKSLLIQYEDDKYKISKDSKEKEYFHLIKRSVYLMQSIVYLVDLNPSSSVMEGIKFIAYNAQIQNDINDLSKEKSYDLLDKKGTLPIVKAIEWANKSKNFTFIENLTQLTRDNSNNQVYDSVLRTIKESGSIEYCKILALSFRIRATDILIEEFPDKEKLIRKFVNQ